MPKKSKMNKLSRLSDEERARYLQHRADVEEEARRRKRELIAKFIQNKLNKEEAFSRINTAKLNQGWRFILRKIKCNQMALEIQGLMGSFNFVLERKNRLVASLMSAVDDADEQHRRAFEAHAETLNYFLSIGAQRLDKLQNDFEHQKNMLLENWDKEELDIVERQDRAEFKLKLIIYIQNSNFTNYKKEKELEWATISNDTRLEARPSAPSTSSAIVQDAAPTSILQPIDSNIIAVRTSPRKRKYHQEILESKHEEGMRNLCAPKQLEIEKYWRELRDVYSKFIEQHKPIMGHYQLLREKDEFYQRDIARNEMQIKQTSELLLNLQKEWINTTKSMESKLNRMNHHKEELSKKYWQMKKEYKICRQREDETMLIMVDASQNAVKRMEEVKDIFNKIKGLSEICHKYEVEGDKLTEIEDKGQLDEFQHLDKNMINECKEFNKMEKFLLKVNRVKVQTLCLKAEKLRLTKENIQLKHYIKKYLTDLALRGGKHRAVSSKLSVEANINRNNKIPRPVTCIEGVLSNAVMHERRMKIERKHKEADTIKSYPRMCV